MKYEFYDELETIATYPLALLTVEERSEIITNGDKDYLANMSQEQKHKIADQIDTFFDENQQPFSEHVHEVRVIQSLNKLREKCDSLGIPWEKAHIVKTIKKAIGSINPEDPLFINLPNDFLLPFLLTCSESIQDLKKVFHDNYRMCDVMSDPHAIRKLCQKPFHEWNIKSEIAVDFLSEYATHVADLHIDLSFCNDLNDEMLRKIARSCPNITSINVSGCSNISDKGIENFATNHHLKHLYCFDCHSISTEEESTLRNLLPHCKIFG